MTGSPSQISVAVAVPVNAGSIESSHSMVVSTAHTIIGAQLIDIHTWSIGSPNGGVPGPEYCQLYCTTCSVTGADIAGGGATSVITTPSSPARNPPSSGLTSRSQTNDGQKLLTSPSVSSTVKHTWNNLVHPVVEI